MGCSGEIRCFTYKETVRAGRSRGVAVSSRRLQSTESPSQVQFWAHGSSEPNPLLFRSPIDNIKYKTKRHTNPNGPSGAAILYPVLIARPLSATPRYRTLKFASVEKV